MCSSDLSATSAQQRLARSLHSFGSPGICDHLHVTHPREELIPNLRDTFKTVAVRCNKMRAHSIQKTPQAGGAGFTRIGDSNVGEMGREEGRERGCNEVERWVRAE